MHFRGAIKRALIEKRYEDAEKLKLQKAWLRFDTTETLSDEVRSRLEILQTLLTPRYEELATAEDIDNCKICNQHLDMIEMILRGPKLWMKRCDWPARHRLLFSYNTHPHTHAQRYFSKPSGSADFPHPVPVLLALSFHLFLCLFHFSYILHSMNSR